MAVTNHSSMLMRSIQTAFFIRLTPRRPSARSWMNRLPKRPKRAVKRILMDDCSQLRHQSPFAAWWGWRATRLTRRRDPIPIPTWSAWARRATDLRLRRWRQQPRHNPIYYQSIFPPCLRHASPGHRGRWRWWRRQIAGSGGPITGAWRAESQRRKCWMSERTWHGRRPLQWAWRE